MDYGALQLLHCIAVKICMSKHEQTGFKYIVNNFNISASFLVHLNIFGKMFGKVVRSLQPAKETQNISENISEIYQKIWYEVGIAESGQNSNKLGSSTATLVFR